MLRPANAPSGRCAAAVAHDVELPGFDGILGAEPLAPAPFQGIHLGKTVIHHLACQTGTGAFIGSGAVQNVFLVLGVVSHPFAVGIGLDMGGTFYFKFR